jgi:polyribonucleotide nucleotidyltransferase
MMIGASMDSIAMVEGEMKKFQAEMLETINLLTNTSKSLLLNTFASCFGKKEVHLRRREEDLHMQSKSASYDKIYAVQAKVLKQERTAALQGKKSKSFIYRRRIS